MLRHGSAGCCSWGRPLLRFTAAMALAAPLDLEGGGWAGRSNGSGWDTPVGVRADIGQWNRAEAAAGCNRAVATAAALVAAVTADVLLAGVPGAGQLSGCRSVAPNRTVANTAAAAAGPES